MKHSSQMAGVRSLLLLSAVCLPPGARSVASPGPQKAMSQSTVGADEKAGSPDGVIQSAIGSDGKAGPCERAGRRGAGRAAHREAGAGLVYALESASPTNAEEAAGLDDTAEMEPMPCMAPASAPSDRWTKQSHGYAFLTSNRQGGKSGERVFESSNHIMASGSRRLWSGTFSFEGMFTLEPATIRPEGSPQLFQRGETYHGRLLVDLQHPHDLFAELAAVWEKDLAAPHGGDPGVRVRFAIAPVGEPAVGPTAFPHRLSASEDPAAPLSHHNQDSTHISDDVVTAGITAGIVTLEGSAFHGGEPDENRWDFDQGRLDSYAGRVTVKPMRGLALQVSAARREHPEELEPGNQTRQTASAEYVLETPAGFLAASLILGRNKLAEGVEWGNTLEAVWKFAGKNFVFGRIENVDRDLFELLNKQQRPPGVGPKRTAVQSLTAGYTRNVPFLSEAESGLGAALTVYRYGDRLDATYGSNPVSFHAFMRLRFGSHGAGGHEHHHGG